MLGGRVRFGLVDEVAGDFGRLFTSRFSAAQSISNASKSRLGFPFADWASFASQALGDSPGSPLKSAASSARISDSFLVPIIGNASELLAHAQESLPSFRRSINARSLANRVPPLPLTPLFHSHTI